jgi:carbon monoxide dehydrogenase subunit G
MILTHKTNKPIAFTWDYLTDMQKFVTVHPVIIKINKTSEGNYLVFETLTLGFIPFSFTYPVTIERQWLNKTVIMRATVMKFTKIEMTFLIQADEGGSIVEEMIILKSPLPVKAIMQRIFKKLHTQLFQNINSL